MAADAGNDEPNDCRGPRSAAGAARVRLAMAVRWLSIAVLLAGINWLTPLPGMAAEASSPASLSPTFLGGPDAGPVRKASARRCKCWSC